MGRHQKPTGLLASVFCLCALSTALGNKGGVEDGSEQHMREYCRRLYGEMSYFNEQLDQCMCLRGYAFNGLRCVPERESTPASPPRGTPVGPGGERGSPQQASAGGSGGGPSAFGNAYDVGEWCPGLPQRSPLRIILGWGTRWLTRIPIVKRLLRMIGGLMGMSFEREDAWQACLEKRQEMARNATALKQAHYDVLKLENRHLFSSLQSLLQQEEDLRRDLDDTIMSRESALQRIGRSIEDARDKAKELEREKAKLIESLGSGSVSSREKQAKEAGRLREINEQLAFSVKMAEQRAQSTLGKAEEVQAAIERHREQERLMHEELRELRRQIEAGNTQDIVESASKRKAAEDGTAKGYDSRCRKKFGENAQWDGKKGCKCSEGYTVRDKKCVKKPKKPNAAPPSSSPRGGGVGR